MRVALLAGGTGGAKLAHGFAQALPPGELSVVVNVADDTERHGLLVCPDLDTVLYTLAGIADPAQGWGVAGDTFTALAMLERLGEESWFRIGDADLALHVRRNRLLRDGLSLTDATANIAHALGVGAQLLPATDARLRTRVLTDAGEIDFQDYFVRNRQVDEVRGLRLDGLDVARPTTAVLETLAGAELVVIGPSNPLVSARGVARLYAGLLDIFVIDEADAGLADPIRKELGIEVAVLPTIMRSEADRAELARRIVALVATGG